MAEWVNASRIRELEFGSPDLTMTPPTMPRPAGRATLATGSYAGFWLRFGALFIDTIVTAVVGGAVVGFILGFSMAASAINDDDAIGLVANIAGLIISWIYYAAMESGPKQATLGKMAVGIKVTDLAGSRIGFGRATGRFFGKYISGIILGVGFLMAAFTERKQGLHDMMAGCLVVRD